MNSSGSARLLKNLGTHLEGVTTVPNEERYGPWAGKILAGAEDQGRIYAVDPEGSEESAAAGADGCLAEDGCFELGIKPEDIDIIPANENFFGVDFGRPNTMGCYP